PLILSVVELVDENVFMSAVRPSARNRKRYTPSAGVVLKVTACRWTYARWGRSFWIPSASRHSCGRVVSLAIILAVFSDDQNTTIASFHLFNNLTITSTLDQGAVRLHQPPAFTSAAVCDWPSAARYHSTEKFPSAARRSRRS